MSLIFAGIVPHSPLLIPGISKERIDVMRDSYSAIQNLREHLYVSHPEVLIVISPYMQLCKSAFSINAHATFKADFSKFGDLMTERQWVGSPALAAYISKKGRTHGEKVQLISDTHLSHGISVPLLTLTDRLPNLAVLPMGPSMAEPSALFKFGELLTEVIHERHERVAVIVSGHLLHRSKSKKGLFYRAQTDDFDTLLIEHLQQRNTAAIISMNPKKKENEIDSLYPSLLILLGMIKNTSYSFKSFCYETLLTTGYLTGNFNI